MESADKNITSFFAAIEPVRAAYQNINFNYLAIKQDGRFHLIQGRLFLNTGTLTKMREPYKSENIIVGSVLLSQIAGSIEEFIDKLLSGSITVVGDEILFLGREKEQYDFYHQPFHQEGLQNQHRLNVLTIRGSHAHPFLRQPALDWELMAAETPYGSLQDIAYEYGVGFINQDAVNVEIIAFQVAAISGESTINNGKATITANIALNLITEQATVGYNVHQRQKVVKRGRIDGTSMQWETKEAYQSGRFELDVPEGGLVHCFASYAGVAQQRYWVTNPAEALNPFRAAYETFDPNLDLLQKAFVDGSKNRSAQFEAAVACLCWMLGFSPAPVDKISTGLEVSDIIATSPQGHFLVIECTTGLLKEDNKIPKLHDRALTVRTKLQATGNNIFNVLPILVTSKSREHVKTELEAAEKHGILVMTLEDLKAAIERLYVYPNPDKLYDEALQMVRDAQNKHQEQGVLELANTA